MKSSEIAQYLKSNYKYTGSFDSKSFLRIEMALPLSSHMCHSTLFICENREDLSCDGAVVLCNDASAVVPKKNSIYIETELSLREVFDKLFDWWDDKQRAEDTCLAMYGLISENESTETLMDIAYGHLGNPILFADYKQNLIAVREPKGISMPQWRELVDTGEYSIDNYNESFYEVHSTITNRKDILKLPVDGYNFCFCSIFCNCVYMGVFQVMEYERAVSEGDLDVIRTMAKLLSVQIEKFPVYPPGTKAMFDQIICDLLDGRIETRNELEMRMRKHRWEAADNLQIMLIEVPKPGHQGLEQKLKNGFARCLSNTKCIVYAKYIVALSEGAAHEKARVELEKFCIQFGTYIGMSRMFSDMFDLQHYYNQAKNALLYGKKCNSSFRVFDYQRFAMDDIVNSLCRLPSCRFLYHPVVLELAEYDRINATDFSSTLYAYIKHNRSIAKASVELFLHKNTINYRIQRIRELYNVNYDDFQELAHIFLTYAMMKEDAGR
ncbi:helix-turn-helix domain-containing protein [Sedimentibacter hydroxybenzoicus DSM 7310]|uniref:Helix-turn-helix domain-containing protein n=1 Tax=Sedimentibacter hydroxybenzoicus DSM 7310 TaxID=1123245 RepID=A0A974BJ07_SEDHY|nr:helix-turn-helix domain-containing protein [Sedimentibacter hydroxybenzoicus]NYB73786.1 helix-turn-helix domain-containing protein [Sedimentibacter hydroxybenzoicus DSM 7310]